MEKHTHSPARQELNRKRLDRTAFAYYGVRYDDCDSHEKRIIYDFVMMEDALCDLIYAEHYVDEVIAELRTEPLGDPVTDQLRDATLAAGGTWCSICRGAVMEGHSHG